MGHVTGCVIHILTTRKNKRNHFSLDPAALRHQNSMTKMYDVSLTVSEQLPVWPDDPTIKMTLSHRLEKGDPCNVMALQFSTHTGTHIDAPFHFLSTGASIEQLPLDILIGPCRVLEFSHLAQSIDHESLRKLNLEGIKRILFKTRNSEQWQQEPQVFDPNYVYLTTEGATYLNEIGIQLIGIDTLSIEKFNHPGHPTHHVLLKNRVIILEGLNLSEVPQGDYELIALPLKLKGADGAPARVVLREWPV